MVTEYWVVMLLFSPLSWSLGSYTDWSLSRDKDCARTTAPDIPLHTYLLSSPSPLQTLPIRGLCLYELRMQLGARSRATMVLPSRILQQSSPDSFKTEDATADLVQGSLPHPSTEGHLALGIHIAGFLASRSSLPWVCSIQSEETMAEESPCARPSSSEETTQSGVVKQTCDPSNQETEGG